MKDVKEVGMCCPDVLKHLNRGGARRHGVLTPPKDTDFASPLVQFLLGLITIANSTRRMKHLFAGGLVLLACLVLLARPGRSMPDER